MSSEIAFMCAARRSSTRVFDIQRETDVETETEIAM